MSIGHVGGVCEAIEDFAAVAADAGDMPTARRLLRIAARERKERQVWPRPAEAERLADLRLSVETACGPDTDAPRDDWTTTDVVVAELLGNAPET